mmetsp:Transcript_5899/g.16847  ORF Transcript_5899/g.16847 Transcript_5899/m.16847 type:complete len:271 (-) Transcript_5899:1018-1830(-)
MTHAACTCATCRSTAPSRTLRTTSRPPAKWWMCEGGPSQMESCRASGTCSLRRRSVCSGLFSCMALCSRGGRFLWMRRLTAPRQLPCRLGSLWTAAGSASATPTLTWSWSPASGRNATWRWTRGPSTTATCWWCPSSTSPTPWASPQRRTPKWTATSQHSPPAMPPRAKRRSPSSASWPSASLEATIATSTWFLHPPPTLRGLAKYIASPKSLTNGFSVVFGLKGQPTFSSSHSVSTQCLACCRPVCGWAQAEGSREMLALFKKGQLCID